MLLRIALYLLLFFLQFIVQAQPLRSELLQRLYDADQPIASIYTPSLTGLFPNKTDKRYPYNKQYLVKTDRQLLLGLAGTGILYELIPISAGVFDIKRIDSTLYAGNNFCAANFSFDSVVYSYGGYGFWKTNGSLKQYNPFSREWDIIPLFDERASTFCQGPSGVNWKRASGTIPDLKDFNTTYAPSFFWVDPVSKLFFMGAQHVINEGLTDSLVVDRSEFNAQISMLDITKKQWTTLGKLNKYGWHYTIQLPWGLLIIESPESAYIADFKNNKVLYCKSDLLPQFRKFFKNEVPDVFFYTNNFIYVGSPSLNTIDSIPLQFSNFVFTGEQLFVKEGESRNSILSLSLFYWVVIILFSLLVAGVIFWFVRRNRLKRYLSSSAIADSTVSFSERIKILNETEIELIHYLINKSVKGKKTTIEEVNKLAGVAQKSEPIRRRVRSELINSINEKWIVVTGSRDRLITSVKSSFDARTREYYIAEKWLISDIIIQLSKNKLPG